MKILFLANAASIHTVRWVNALSERGHEVHLVYKFDDEPKDNKISQDVNLHRLKYSGRKGYYLNVKQLKSLYNSIKPHVVNVHYASGYGTLARISKMKPLVLSVWGSDVYDFPYKNKLSMKTVVDNLKYANQIASTSNSMANQVRRLLKDKNKNIGITPFGVNIEHFSNNKDNGLAENNIIIGTIKALSYQYGIDDFIQSIKILKDNLKTEGHEELSNKIFAKIYGDGQLKDELQNLINKLGLAQSVSLEGRIPNTKVPLALEEFDVFAATSVVNESFGVSVVEAMSMKLPVVATDVPGFKEIVDDGKTGVIVERNNPEAIAEALERLVLDSDLRKAFGLRGRKKVERLYNWDDNVNKMIDIYNSIHKMIKGE